jgi:hypothetical protein
MYKAFAINGLMTLEFGIAGANQVANIEHV